MREWEIEIEKEENGNEYGFVCLVLLHVLKGIGAIVADAHPIYITYYICICISVYVR